MTTPFPFVAGQVLTAAQLNDIQNLPISDKTASYTLVAGDETKRTIMNNAGATTITVNDAIFTVGDVIQVANKGAGVCTITAGSGVTINTSGSLALAQYGGGYLLCLSASTFTFFNLGGGVSYGTATGGSSSSISDGGINYTLLTFTTDGTLTITKAGLFDCFILGGGSGGGREDSSNSGGGGGGGGGIFLQTLYLTDASYAVQVGAGGAGSNSTNGNGFNGTVSYIGEYNAGFGGAGDGASADLKTRLRGMSTAGGVRGQSGVAGQASQPVLLGNQGALGGTGGNDSGGGGGGQSVGGNPSAGQGGIGGAGLTSTFNGSSIVYGSGGGGGSYLTGGAGGTNAGTGGSNAVGGNASPANRGAGGGGGGKTNNGGAGSSGIVMVRFKI